ncbi:unnamed protein product [Didymodactylos carnosus]|uniref:Protein kinase domain-containing protein n=1 Tax=Didymodactylos carnosus TaxID=1234261 RepID=A0A814TY92_9BILA|nr:unnamed protein product [Didymodactylos carnosus]CAF1167420.1 unnamed protein product [Didymodactylos carnosus]CAF3722992.1 unnamed protein product [Didymodactylos carnosus]CAF3930952.1 unnamed protein product [Didymodactylos carnosus]
MNSSQVLQSSSIPLSVKYPPNLRRSLVSSLSTSSSQSTIPSDSGPLTPDVGNLVNPFVTAAQTIQNASIEPLSAQNSPPQQNTGDTTTTTQAEQLSPSPIQPVVRHVGDYDLTEIKFDDFRCARHRVTGEECLYKEFPLDTLRQRLEPYYRLANIMLRKHSTNTYHYQTQSLQTETFVQTDEAMFAHSTTSHINNLSLNQRGTTSDYEIINQLSSKYHIHFYREIITLQSTAIVLYPKYSSNLHTYITEKHRLNENECRRLFTQIINSVKLCHQVGLIVRDLKLRKIIFTNQQHTQLLLTGLDDAIILQDTTNDLVSSRFSCPVYACPEIVLNRQMYSGKMADSWSLGIILYTMLFGRYPFCDKTLMGLFIKIGRCRPDISRTITLKARSLLRSLIRVKPDERLLSNDILGHVWFRDMNSSNSINIDEISGGGYNDLTRTAIATNELENDLTMKEDAVVPNIKFD